MVLGELEIRLRADIARLQRDMDSARRVVSDTASGISRAADMMKAALASIGIGAGIAEIARMSDEYAKFTAQLKLASTSQREYAASYADVKRIATSAQQSLSATGTLYARIANGTRELGTTQKQVAAITETVNLALRVSGATATESASAQLQLSQAFASGTLRGEEFNAVNEAAPRLMKALADGMGLPVGALKAMAGEGQITSKIMADVLPAALEKLREEAKEISTIGGAFTVLKNELMEFTATKAQANGTVMALTTGIRLLTENLGLLMGVLSTLGAAKIGEWLAAWSIKTYQQIIANRALAASTLALAVASTETAATTAAAKLVEAQANVRATASAVALADARVIELRAAVLASEGVVALAIATNGLIPAQARATALAEAHAIALRSQALAAGTAASTTLAAGAALSAQAAAGTIAVRVMGLLRGAMAFFGGPVGLVITLLGAAAMAWSHFGSKAKEESAKAAVAVTESTSEMISRLDEQIAKLKERNRLQGVQATIPLTGMDKLSEADRDGIARAREDIEAATNGTGRFEGRSLAKRQLAIKNLTEFYDTALARLKEVQAESAAIEARSYNQKYAKWQGENGTADQKRAYELAALRKEYGTLTEQQIAFVNAKYADKSAAGANKEETAYKSLMTSIAEKIAANKLEIAGYDKLTDSQKATIKLDAEISTGKTKLGADSIASARAQIAVMAMQEESIKRTAEAIEMKSSAERSAIKNDDEMYAKISKGTTDIDDQIAKMKEQIETYGLTEVAVIDLATAKAQAALAAGPASYAELVALEAQIEKLKELRALAGNKESLDIAKKAADDAASTWKRTADSIEQSITDALLRGFESGKSFGKNLIDTLKNMFKTLVLTPTIQGIVAPVAGALGASMGGAAQAAGGSASAGTSALGLAGSLGSIGTGAMQTAGALFSGQIGFGSTLSAGLSAIGTGSASGIISGLSSVVGVLGPIALGIGAAVAIWKKLDTSGTYHTGGASSASAAGVNSVRAESLNFQPTKVSVETEKLTAALATGIVGILDSTALAFGKTAGYTAATAFADDTSKDGAWGALLINKMGEKIVDWQDSRTSRWAPKEFADGKAGQEQYVAALATSVRGALEDIGLPDWARKMLNDLGNAPTIEDLEKVVSTINATQNALAIMGQKLVGFSGLSESATTSLIIAAGGIEKLAGSASGYYDNFYSDAEKFGNSTQLVTDALKAVGVQMPATREAYRAEVEARLKLGEAGAPAVAALLANASAFANLTPVAVAAADAVNSLKDVEAERADLQRQYDDLTLTSAQLLDKQRNALDASNRSLFDQVQVQIKANAVSDERKTLQQEYDSLTMTSTQLLNQQREALDGSNQALFDNIQAVKSQKTAAEVQKASVDSAKAVAAGLVKGVDDAFAVLQRVTSAEKDRITAAHNLKMDNLQVEIDAETKANADRKAQVSAAVTNARALSDAIRASLDQATDVGSEGTSRASAQAAVFAALAIARAGGGLPSAESLKGPLSTLARDSTDLFATMQDYQRDFYRTQNSLTELGTLSDSALSVEEKTLKELEEQKSILGEQKEVLDQAYKAEVSRLDGILSSAQSQIDVLKGIDTTGLSIVQALEAVRLAIVAAQANAVSGSTSAINDAYKTSLGRAPDAAGMEYWQNAVAGGQTTSTVVGQIQNSMEAQVRGIYKDLLGRDADAAGLNFFLKSGSSISEISRNIVDSDEYQKKLRGFAVGTNDVPYDMVAQIHEGERIIPAADNRLLMQRLSSPSDNSAVLAAAVDRLTAKVADQQAALDKISNNTGRGADTIERVTDGGVAMRTKEEPA